jgi:hypothetical protein
MIVNGLFSHKGSTCCGRNSRPRQDNDLMNYEQKSTNSYQRYEFQEKARLIFDNWKQDQDMSTIGVNESEKQYPSTLYLYPTHLFYITCGSSHLYGGGLSLKLLSLYSKLSKSCALRSKASLKRWLGPQVAWFALQVALTCTPNYPKVVPCALRYRHRFVTTS